MKYPSYNESHDKEKNLKLIEATVNGIRCNTMDDLNEVANHAIQCQKRLRYACMRSDILDSNMEGFDD